MAIRCNFWNLVATLLFSLQLLAIRCNFLDFVATNQLSPKKKIHPATLRGWIDFHLRFVYVQVF